MTFCFSLFFSLNTQVLDAMNEALTHGDINNNKSPLHSVSWVQPNLVNRVKMHDEFVSKCRHVNKFK